MLYFTTELNNSKIPPTFQEWDTSDLMEQHYLEHHGSSHPAVLTQASACTPAIDTSPFPQITRRPGSTFRPTCRGQASRTAVAPSPATLPRRDDHKRGACSDRFALPSMSAGGTGPDSPFQFEAVWESGPGMRKAAGIPVYRAAHGLPGRFTPAPSGSGGIGSPSVKSRNTRANAHHIDGSSSGTLNNYHNPYLQENTHHIYGN